MLPCGFIHVDAKQSCDSKARGSESPEVEPAKKQNYRTCWYSFRKCTKKHDVPRPYYTYVPLLITYSMFNVFQLDL